jgi:hypothetical protein
LYISNGFPWIEKVIDDACQSLGEKEKNNNNNNNKHLI